MSLFSSPKTTLVSPDQALPGRAQRPFPIPARHPVLGHPLEAPDGWPDGLAVLSLAMGCFWGAERRLWQLPGVYTTAVGYQGGATPNPTYDEVCTGRTGHTESVLVVYDPATLPEYDLFKTFWEHHDPTQGFRQGNDIGTQYRSAVYWTTPSQQDAAEATAAAYGAVLREHGLDPITTELAPAAGRPFYYAEPAHQQYLWTNPFGYDCHANTGLELPPPS